MINRDQQKVLKLIDSALRDVDDVRRDMTLNTNDKEFLLTKAHRKLMTAQQHFKEAPLMMKKIVAAQQKLLDLSIKYLNQISLWQKREKSFWARPYYAWKTKTFAKKEYLFRKYANLYAQQKKLDVVIQKHMSKNTYSHMREHLALDNARSWTVKLLQQHKLPNHKQYLNKRHDQTVFCFTKSHSKQLDIDIAALENPAEPLTTPSFIL